LEQKQLIFIVFSIIIFASVGSALSYKVDSNVPIHHSVRLGGSPTTGASCNITVINPLGNSIVDFQPMTANTNTQTYNYTVSGNLLNLTGIYPYDITCVESPLNATESFSFELTNSGKEFTVGQSILYIFLLILSIGVFVLLIFLYFNVNLQDKLDINGEVLEFNTNKHFKLLFGSLAYMMFVWLTYLTWNISHTYLELSAGSNFFYPLFRISLTLLFPIILVTGILMIVQVVRSKKLNKKLERGEFLPNV
jgi:uncharacterized membrane protein